MRHGIGHIVGYHPSLPQDIRPGNIRPPRHQTGRLPPPPQPLLPPLPSIHLLPTTPPTIYPLLGTSSGDHWRPVQTCSFGDLPHTPPHPRSVDAEGGHRR